MTRKTVTKKPARKEHNPFFNPFKRPDEIVDARKDFIRKLPDELVDMVCGYLPSKSLKRARLVCKRWNPFCEKYLFDTVILWKTESDWYRLYNICQTPHLASVFAHLKLVRMDNLPRCGEDYDDYEHKVSDRLLNGSDRALRHGYRRYREWRKDERYMDEALRLKGSNNLRSYLNFNLLSYRLTVETIGYAELRELYHQREDQDRYTHNRREQETLIEGNRNYVSGNQHLELFLKVIEENGGDGISYLELHHTEEVLLNKPALRHRLTHLVHLFIDLDRQYRRKSWEDFFVVGKEWPAAPWICNLPNLQRFELSQEQLDPACNLLIPLQKVQWPRLKHIELYNVTTTEEAILSFLNKFKTTLRSLTIEEPVIRPSTLALVRQELSRSDTNFKILRPADCVISEVFDPEQLDCYFEGSEEEFNQIRRIGGEMWEQTKDELLEKWHNDIVFLP